MEFITSNRTREELLEQLAAFVADGAAFGAKSATLSYGWDSSLGISEMWKPFHVTLGEVLPTILEAEARQVVRLGESDVFIELHETRLQLCHEGDLHICGEGELCLMQVSRWRALGFSPVSTYEPTRNEA
jgi:hypothetical protein